MTETYCCFISSRTQWIQNSETKSHRMLQNGCCISGLSLKGCSDWPSFEIKFILQFTITQLTATKLFAQTELTCMTKMVIASRSSGVIMTTGERSRTFRGGVGLRLRRAGDGLRRLSRDLQI